MMQLPGGFWPLMLTPFTEDNKPDLDGIRKLTDIFLRAGVSGIFANCLSSEMYHLSDEERLAITRTVIDRCNGQVPVVATGSFPADAGDPSGFIKKIYQLGASCVILIPGILAKQDENDEILKQRFEKILARTDDIPLGTYECPLPYKRLLSPGMMQWLVGTGRFFFHKDTSCDNDAIRMKLKKTRNSNYRFFNADTPTFLESLKDGASGITPISGNFYPELYIHLLNLYSAGNDSQLEPLNAWLTVADKVTHVSYPLSAKIFLNKRGLTISPHTRIPLEKMNRRDEKGLDALHQIFMLKMEKLGLTSLI